MRLTMEQLRSAAQGTAYLEETGGEVCFHRFTAEQEALYKTYSEEFWRKTFATAGVKLRFRTDSDWMRLRVRVLQTMPRTYFALDVAVDGAVIGAIENYSDQVLPEDYTTISCDLGAFEKRFELGSGTKTVTIYFPWTVDLRIADLELADGAAYVPVRPGKTLLTYGDSITQGYDALHPSNRYTARLAEVLEAEEINKAIGGEVFFPPLAQAEDGLMPDYITVAYGTNDWSKTDRETLRKHARAFYGTLCHKYPEAKLFALLPIWRKDRDEYRPYGSFDQMRRDLTEVAGELGIPVIDCYEFVPKEETCFADLRLHPNDKGFVSYAQCLANAILEETR